MSRLGRGASFKPSRPLTASQWYINFYHPTVIAVAQIAVANGVAAPLLDPFRGDAIARAYSPTGESVMQPLGTTGTGSAAIPSAGSINPIGNAVAVGIARDPLVIKVANHTIDWVSGEFVQWVSGEAMEWVS